MVGNTVARVRRRSNIPSYDEFYINGFWRLIWSSVTQVSVGKFFYNRKYLRFLHSSPDHCCYRGRHYSGENDLFRKSDPDFFSRVCWQSFHNSQNFGAKDVKFKFMATAVPTNAENNCFRKPVFGFLFVVRRHFSPIFCRSRVSHGNSNQPRTRRPSIENKLIWKPDPNFISGLLTFNSSLKPFASSSQFLTRYL